MRFALVIPLILPALLSALGGNDESVKSLITKLGSANYQEREAAGKALQQRPQAELALRAALSGADLETRRRITVILASYHARKLRELKTLAKEGRVDEFIKRAAMWPAEKDEEELFSIVQDLARAIKDLHVKKGGYNLQLLTDKGKGWKVLCTNSVTSLTKADEEARYFLRAREVNITCEPPINNPNEFHKYCAIVASGKVCVDSSYGTYVIFAGDSVEIRGNDVHSTVIVSGGDVVLNSQSVAGSIVIARGNITIANEQVDNRIIAGKSIVKELGRRGRFESRDCIITENEPNPLGFIRWSDPPKQKAEAKQP